MAAVLIKAASDVKSQFSIKEVDSSNTVFKLFSKITVGLCVIASILVATSEYLGSPINCQTSSGKIVGDVYDAYCWIHGGKKISHKSDSKAYELFKCSHPDNVPELNNAVRNNSFIDSKYHFLEPIYLVIILKALRLGYLKRFLTGLVIVFSPVFL